MYVYKYHDDSAAYGCETVELYSSFEEARERLVSTFRFYFPGYGKTLEEVAANPMFHNGNNSIDVTEDSIHIEVITDTECHFYTYFTVEPIKVERSGDNEPAYHIRFADPVDETHSNFTCGLNAIYTVADIYAYSDEHLIALMERVTAAPLGMWYWVVDLSSDAVIMTGACDPGDVNVIRRYLSDKKEETT